MIQTFVYVVLLTTVYAALQSSDSLPPLDDISPSRNLDLQLGSDSNSIGDNGYRYKTVKRLRLRHRRAVNELPFYEYLPPSQPGAAVADIPVFFNAPAITEQGSTVLADDGYHYKTLKRIRYRDRRDTNDHPLLGEFLKVT